MELTPGTLLKSIDPKSPTAHWVGVVTRIYEGHPHLCYVRWPQRADFIGEMNGVKTAALELTAQIAMYKVISPENEKRHLYSPDLWQKYPWFCPKNQGYLTYKEYLEILESEIES